jgi:hypothetical protein
VPKTRTPRVGEIHPGLYCVIRPDGRVTLFLNRPAAIRHLRLEALEKGRQTRERRREAAYLRIRRREETLMAAERWDGVWELVGLPLPDKHPPGPTRTGGMPGA